MGFVGAGITTQNSYLRIDGANLWDNSVSFGGGMNITRGLTAYTGIELGKKGNKNSNQIQENYTQFVFGIAVRDIWLGKKFKRYD